MSNLKKRRRIASDDDDDDSDENRGRSSSASRAHSLSSSESDTSPSSTNRRLSATDEEAISKEAQRLKALAYERGIITQKQKGSAAASSASTASIIPVPSALRQYNNQDLHNKNQSRGNPRYLFILPGRFQLTEKSSTASNTSNADAGTTTDMKASSCIGSVSQMDTRNPVLYLSFPTGRLKLLGSIVYTSNTQIIAIQYNNRQNKKLKPLVCRGAYDHLFVFSDYYWIGTAEENPEERPLPLPTEIQQRESIHVTEINTEQDELTDAVADTDDAEIVGDHDDDADDQHDNMVTNEDSAYGSADDELDTEVVEVESDHAEEEEEAVSVSRPRRASRREVHYDVDFSDEDEDEEEEDQDAESE